MIQVQPLEAGTLPPIKCKPLPKQAKSCPHCGNSRTRAISRKTALGYQMFFCKKCTRHFNERSGTPFNFLEVPTDVVFLVVQWYLEYNLSLRELAKMLSKRGLHVTHETVRDWVARFTFAVISLPCYEYQRCPSRKPQYIRETPIKVQGKWCILYRAFDRYGSLVDIRLSD